MCKFTDREGRLLCDPAGKGGQADSSTRAVYEAIDTILNQSDYILVN